MSGAERDEGVPQPAMPAVVQTGGGQGPDGGTGPDEKRFGFELQQASVNALGDACRKLSIYASAVVGVFGWAANSPIRAAVTAFGVWVVIQAVAIVVESVRVYPTSRDRYGKIGTTSTPGQEEGDAHERRN